MDWKVLIEVARGEDAGEIGVDDVHRLMRAIGPRAGALHHEERYALQLSIEARTAAEAVGHAVSLWDTTTRELELPCWMLVRAEVLTADEYVRECRLYEDGGSPDPPSLAAAFEIGTVRSPDEVVLWQAVPATLTDLASDPGVAAVPDGPIRVAVCDRASSYRRGLGSVLAAAGHLVEEVDVPPQHIVEVDVLLLTVRSASDWQVVRDLVSVNRDLKLVALLVDPTPDLHAEALRCGAHAAVPWESPPEAIAAIVAGAVYGVTVFPRRLPERSPSAGMHGTTPSGSPPRKWSGFGCSPVA